MKIFKFSLLAVMLMVFSNNTFSQVNKENALLKLLDGLSKADQLNEFKERSQVPKDYKKRLIICDLMDSSIAHSMHEGASYIIATTAEIIKWDIGAFLKPKNIYFSKDSSSIEFEVITKYGTYGHGKLTLYPYSRTGIYDDVDFKTKFTCSMVTQK